MADGDWRPGMPVVSDSDRTEWAAWRRQSKREAQRLRRARYPRIDYYPDPLANEVIRSMSGPHPGGDLSGVISRIVAEWAQDHGRLPPE